MKIDSINEVVQAILDLPGINLKQLNEKINNISSGKDFSDVMFKKDDTGCQVLYYLFLEKRFSLLKEVLETYEEKLKKVPASKWDFIYMEKSNQAHQMLLDFYGEKYYQKIIDKNSKVLPYVHVSYLSQLLNEGIYDNFFKDFNNIKKLNIDYNPFIFVAGFLLQDKEKTINFIKEESQKDATYERFFLKFAHINATNFYNLEACLPSPAQIDVIKTAFTDKSSEIMREFLNITEDFYKNVKRNDFKQLVVSSKNFTYFIQQNFDLGECEKYLPKYIEFNSELVLYCLLTKKINAQYLMECIHDPLLKSEAQYGHLNSHLQDAGHKSTKHKI